MTSPHNVDFKTHTADITSDRILSTRMWPGSASAIILTQFLTRLKMDEPNPLIDDKCGNQIRQTAVTAS